VSTDSNKKKKLLIIISAVIAVLLITALVLILVFTLGKDKNAGNTDIGITGITGYEKATSDYDSCSVGLSVDSSVTTITADSLTLSDGLSVKLYADAECTREITDMRLNDGTNVFYAKLIPQEARI
jgi:hypothetical protein